MNATQIKPGVATGDDLQALFQLAKAKQFALPAVNVINTSTVNAVMETAEELNSPVIIQFSNGGAQFYAGKGLSNDGPARLHCRRASPAPCTSICWPSCTA